MLTCNDAEAAIVREVDGSLPGAEREALDAHVAGCQACAALRVAQREVRATVSSRPPARLPPRFLDRVMQQVGEEEASWLPQVDWRRWTEWSLPVAAALMLVAAIAGRPAQPVTTAEAAGVIELWAEGGEPASSPAATALSDEAGTEEMLASLLSVSAASSGEVR